MFWNNSGMGNGLSQSEEDEIDRVGKENK